MMDLVQNLNIGEQECKKSPITVNNSEDMISNKLKLTLINIEVMKVQARAEKRTFKISWWNTIDLMSSSLIN